MTKILATAGMLAVFSFANNSYSQDNNGMGITPGMVGGIGVDIGFAINENKDLKYTPDNTDPTTVATFDAKRDTSYGVYALLGYVMESGLEGALEVGYRQLKEKDKVSPSKLESKQWYGMLRGTYYLDLQSLVYPYIMAGVGVARSEIKATLIQDAESGSAIDPTKIATIDNLKDNKLAYEAGVGISAVMQAAVFSIGYKYFGISSIDDSDSYSDGSFTTFDGTPVEDLTKMKFGSIDTNIHTIEANVKVIF